MSIATISVRDFRERLNQVFVVSLADQELAQVVLVEVQDLPGHSSRQDRARFSLLFHSREAVNLVQRVYSLASPSMDPLDLFLVPVGPDPEKAGDVF